MHDTELLSIEVFKRNIEAISTNRGFYYQYLSFLKKWITNFVDGNDVIIYSEVENDIKEIGEDYVFTQLKCYSSTFSLNSKEVKQSIFDFFILFLEYRKNEINPKFSFVTNTSLKKNEKLLDKWISREVFNSENELELLKNKIAEILRAELKKIRQSKLNKSKLPTSTIDQINNSYQNICSYLNDGLLLEEFCNSIYWQFGEQTTEDAINELKNEIFLLLDLKIFQKRSADIIFRVLLSEVNRCSQEAEKSKRGLNKYDLQKLLELTDNELYGNINFKFINFLGVDLYDLKERILNVETVQKSQAEIIKGLKAEKIENADLTLIPYPPNVDLIIGWDNEIEEVYNIINHKKIVAVQSFGGTGKTTFAKKFLAKHRDSFNNVIWLNIETSLHISVVLNDLMLSNLNIDLDKDLSIEQQFNLIVNELDKHGDNNLIIIDIQSNEDDLLNLNKIASLRKWKKIILSRKKFNAYNPYVLTSLNFEQAKELFQLHYSSGNLDENTFREFLAYIQYNNLIIELVAKTIENSLDLTLEDILEALRKQNLNSESLKIDIELSEDNNVVRIFEFILQKFSINGLDKSVRYFLEYLALLPSSNILIEDLILICGEKYYEGNKPYFINWVNALEKAGLVKFEDTKQSFQIHKILQDAILYSIRVENNAFLASATYISWLGSRLADGYNNPQQSYKYLRYAESILRAIKEEYRQSVYQPLLALENEYLHLSTYFFSLENIEENWENLIKRCTNYLGSENLMLGSMYNNLALSLNHEENLERIINYLKKAIGIFNNHKLYFKDRELLMFITAHNNLAQAFILNNEIDNAVKTFKIVSSIREKYSFYSDAQVGVGYIILSELYRKKNDLQQSKKYIEIAIKDHNLIPLENRNDFLLSTYYNKLSEHYLLINDLNESINYQKKCVDILQSQRISNAYCKSMYQYLIDLYKVSSDFDSAEIYQKKLSNIKFDSINGSE